jgi:hypothetical protein
MLSRSQAIPVRVVPWALLLLVALVAPGAVGGAESEASHVQPIRTAKERLGVKASDEQRVDNCKVPIELRGAKSRPDECTTLFVSCGPSTAQPVAVFNFELIDTSLACAIRPDRRAGENAVPSPPSHVEARLRVCAGQRRLREAPGKPDVSSLVHECCQLSRS